MTKEQLKIKNRAYYLKNREANREANKLKSRLWRANNPKKVSKQGERYRERMDIGGYALYYIHKHNYIGISKTPKHRMYQHKSQGKDVSRYEILTIYDTKREALDAESYMHSLGFKGENKTKYK